MAKRGKELGLFMTGQLLCLAVVFGVFVCIGRFDDAVLWGGLMGVSIAAVNYVCLIAVVDRATRKAGNQDAAGGARLLQGAYLGRMVTVFAALSLCADAWKLHPIVLALPLLLTRPILSLMQRRHWAWS